MQPPGYQYSFLDWCSCGKANPRQPLQHISSLLDQLCCPSYTFTLSYLKPCTTMSSGSMSSGSMSSANLQIQNGRHVKLEEEMTKILSDTFTLGDRVIP